MAKSDYAVKHSLTKKGYEVYNEVANRLQDGSEKSKLAENENAFIYARMAESWARIRNDTVIRHIRPRILWRSMR